MIAQARLTPEFRLLEQTQQAMREAFAHSYTVGMQAVLDELEQVWQECRRKDWDGQGARPLTGRAKEAAIEFLKAFPPGTAAPEVGADPLGYFSFSWMPRPGWALSVAVTPQRELEYAVLLGSQRHCGRLPFYGELPPELAKWLEKVTGNV